MVTALNALFPGIFTKRGRGVEIVLGKDELNEHKELLKNNPQISLSAWKSIQNQGLLSERRAKDLSTQHWIIDAWISFCLLFVKFNAVYCLASKRHYVPTKIMYNTVGYFHSFWQRKMMDCCILAEYDFFQRSVWLLRLETKWMINDSVKVSRINYHSDQFEWIPFMSSIWGLQNQKKVASSRVNWRMLNAEKHEAF